MRDSNLSATRRLEALEARVDAAERAAASQSFRARSWQWPRDTWLGRTYSYSPGSYPTEGDTFQVKLLSCHFTATEGTQAVTELERGTIVTARTWPAAYLARDTEVIVTRMRGLGGAGAGEWWIQPMASGYNRCVMAGRGTADWRYDEGVSEAGNTDIPQGDYGDNSGIWSFPTLVGVVGNTDGQVFGVRNAGGTLGSPSAWNDTWLECYAFTWYRLTVHTTWSLAMLPGSEAEQELAFPRHRHLYIDNPGVVPKLTAEEDLVSTHRRARVNTDSDVWVATEAVPSFGARHELGRSALQLWYNPVDNEPAYATHSGVCNIPGYYRPGPLTFRIRVFSNWFYLGLSVRPRLEYLTVTVEQSSDPIADPAP